MFFCVKTLFSPNSKSEPYLVGPLIFKNVAFMSKKKEFYFYFSKRADSDEPLIFKIH